MVVANMLISYLWFWHLYRSHIGIILYLQLSLKYFRPPLKGSFNLCKRNGFFLKNQKMESEHADYSVHNTRACLCLSNVQCWVIESPFHVMLVVNIKPVPQSGCLPYRGRRASYTATATHILTWHFRLLCISLLHTHNQTQPCPDNLKT